MDNEGNTEIIGLRVRLIETATDMIEHSGAAGLTLRSVARAAGVSHTAPLRHFAGFSDLLAEVAAGGFAELAARVERASDAVPAGQGPRVRLTVACREYVTFATDHAELFALMFRPDTMGTTNRAYRSESTRAHRNFLHLVRSLQDDGWQTTTETSMANAAVWGLVHGLASLWTHGPLQASLADGATLDDVVAEALAALLRD